MVFFDLAGRRFGRLVVMVRVGTSGKNSNPIKITVPRSCKWCNRLRPKRAKWELICKRCGELMRARAGVWADQRYWRTEVLSVGAAEIVRAHFSKQAIQDDFEFKVAELEQWELIVWRERRQYAGCVQRRNGQYVNLHEV